MSSATLSLYGTNKENGLGSPALVIDVPAPASDSSLGNTDFNIANWAGAEKGRISYANFNKAAYNDIALNTNAVRAAGITKLGGRLSWDFDNSATGLKWASGGFSSFSWTSAGNGSNKPKLCVSYTVGVTPTPTPTPGPSEPIALAANPYLFVDDYLIGSSSGVTRVVRQPVRTRSNPVVTSGTGELAFQPFVTVLREGSGSFRMWYNASSAAVNPDYYGPNLAYLESTDGRTWNPPLQRSTLLHSVGAAIIDRGSGYSPASERYRMVYAIVLENVTAPNDFAKARIAFSSDGITWGQYSDVDTLFPGSFNSYSVNKGDILNSHYDALHGKYVLFYRDYGPYTWTNKEGQVESNVTVRRTGILTSSDYKTWSAPAVLFSPDNQDSGVTEWYGGPAGVIQRGDLLIGFLKELRDDVIVKGAPIDAYGFGYTVLAYSRDGINWTRDRYTDKFFEPDTTVGAWDHAHAWIDSSIAVGDELYLYYGGYKWGHKYNSETERQIGLVTLPTDRFVARRAGATAGTLTTRLVIPQAETMALNVDADAGSVAVKVLDPAGAVVGACTTLTNVDSLTAPLTCTPAFSTYVGQAVKFEFTLTDADLYAFTLAAAAATLTPTPTATVTPTDTPTPTPAPNGTPTWTATSTETATATLTSTPTVSPTASAVSTVLPPLKLFFPSLRLTSNE